MPREYFLAFSTNLFAKVRGVLRRLFSAGRAMGRTHEYEEVNQGDFDF
jgi:hypothetical protein